MITLTYIQYIPNYQARFPFQRLQSNNRLRSRKQFLWSPPKLREQHGWRTSNEVSLNSKPCFTDHIADFGSLCSANFKILWSKIRHGPVVRHTALQWYHNTRWISRRSNQTSSSAWFRLHPSPPRRKSLSLQLLLPVNHSLTYVPDGGEAQSQRKRNKNTFVRVSFLYLVFKFLLFFLGRRGKGQEFDLIHTEIAWQEKKIN